MFSYDNLQDCISGAFPISGAGSALGIDINVKSFPAISSDTDSIAIGENAGGIQIKDGIAACFSAYEIAANSNTFTEVAAVTIPLSKKLIIKRIYIGAIGTSLVEGYYYYKYNPTTTANVDSDKLHILPFIKGCAANISFDDDIQIYNGGYFIIGVYSKGAAGVAGGNIDCIEVADND